MIQKLEINGVHFKLDSDLKKYVTNKIGKLDRYMSRYVRESAHAEVKLIESKQKARKQATCEVVLYLPKSNITTKETTVNMYAAIDIVEQKLKNRLKKYKETHGKQRIHKRVINRVFKGRLT